MPASPVDEAAVTPQAVGVVGRNVPSSSNCQTIFQLTSAQYHDLQPNTGESEITEKTKLYNSL